jgi:excisionase family DNA binding protein
MEKMLLTPIEAAAALSISRSKLYELMSGGRIGSVRIDGCRRVPVRALQDYVEGLTEYGEDQDRSAA